VDRATHLHSLHAARLRELDPSFSLPELDLGGDPEVLVASDGEAVALVEHQHTDPDSGQGLWTEEDVVRVQVRCSTDADPAALTDLLVRAHAAVPDRGPAHLVVAARDLLLLRPLLDAGYAPGSVLALHALAPSEPPRDPTGSGAIVVREATEDDLEPVVAAGVAVQAFDRVAGVLPERPGAAAVMREAAVETLGATPGSWWVAERDDLVVGVCELRAPGAASWATSWVAGDAPTSYLALMHVEARERGQGIGRALVSAAHDHASASGAARVILHHGATNPLSVPFWGRAGYRPLLGGWLRQAR
jgi:GNAT superfamily N-acetyltransferase